jgi:hypothetical protein
MRNASWPILSIPRWIVNRWLWLNKIRSNTPHFIVDLPRLFLELGVRKWQWVRRLLPCPKRRVAKRWVWCGIISG